MKIFDFTSRKTEADWRLSIDNLGLNATPIWFMWLEWATILGIFQFIVTKFNGVEILYLPISISYFLLWLYFQALFNSFHFRFSKKQRNERLESFLSITFATTLAYSFFWLITKLVQIFVENYSL